VVAAAPAAPVRTYRRVEDLPSEPVRRVEDLPVAPPSPVRALRPEEVTPALLLVADDLLWNTDPPLGTEVPIEVENQVYVARLELHFHPVGGRVRPWGYHKGVTLYATE
jgi:hypothetical protein